MSERLQKYLARAGIGSRRACEVLIKEGKVSLNGNLAKIGATVSNQDIVEFEGKVIQVKETDLKVIILNKPEGCLLYTSPSPRDRTRSRMPSSA